VDVKRASTTEPLRFLRRGRGEQVSRNRRLKARRRILFFLGGSFALGLMAGIAYAARYHLTHSPRFRLRRVEFASTARVPREELRRPFARHMGRNVFRLDLDRLERAVEENRWVKRAVVKRVLPDAVSCSIEERVPRGLALIRDRVWLVDEEGSPIQPYGPGAETYSWPIFSGIDETSASKVRGQVGRGVALLSYLERTHPELVREISEIDLSRDDRLEARMNDGGTVVRLHPRDFGTNLERYLAVRDYLATDLGEGLYVDLRFRDRVVFRPQPGRKD
jgi:cell division septal protein FtsQ